MGGSFLIKLKSKKGEKRGKRGGKGRRKKEKEGRLTCVAQYMLTIHRYYGN